MKRSKVGKVMIRVEKYGGSSVATIEKINLIASSIKTRVQMGYKIVVVTSAMGKTTNQLVEQAKQINPKISGRELDALLATGEEQAAAILTMALNNIGVDAISLNAYQAKIYASNEYQNGFIKSIDFKTIIKHLKDNKVIVLTGFQGIAMDKSLVTLGRGGSDTTAVALAVGLKCPCYIYSDVDGVYTIDPRLYPSARHLKEVSYDEMIELASSGSKVFVTRAALLAKYYQVPTILLESMKEGGTNLVNELLEKREISGISVKSNLVYIKIIVSDLDERKLGIIFDLINKCGLLIGMVFYDKNSNLIAFTINKNDELKFDEIILDLKNNQELKSINVNKEYCYDKLTIVGHGINQYPGIISKIYTVLASEKIIIYQMTSNEMSISLLINKKYLSKTLELLVKTFELGR